MGKRISQNVVSTDPGPADYGPLYVCHALSTYKVTSILFLTVTTTLFIIQRTRKNDFYIEPGAYNLQTPSIT